MLAPTAVAAGVALSLALWLRLSPPSVPLVDASSLLDAHDATAVRTLRRAAGSLGVVRLSGQHGLDADAALGAAASLFALPLEAKRNASIVRGGFQRGYIPMGGEAGLATNLELKEGFCYGYPWDDAVPAPDALTGANAWPAPLDAPSRDRMLALHANASALALRLAAAFSAALGLDGDPLGALCEGGDVVSMMRVFHYFASNVAPGLAPGVPRIGSSPHTDWHFLTLIVQDRGGLQVQARDGRWVDVPARAGEAILIVGDYASALSEGAFRSPVHRVLLPPAGEERTSFTFFFYARFDAKIPAAAARAAARRVEAENAARPPSAPAYNTLVKSAEAALALAERPFGELMLDKWRGVAANAAKS